MKTRSEQKARAAFTLIELMVVIAIIGIMMAGVFRLLAMVGENNRKALTIARLQRLQGALSGFYAEYGTYPPVVQHGSPDPGIGMNADNGKEEPVGSLNAGSASRAAGCQPMGFEFPNRRSLNEYINIRFKPEGIRNVNEVLGPTAATSPYSDWQDVKIFKFGVLSYLLPRVEVIGADGGDTPDSNFFKDTCKQWMKNNEAGALGAQRVRENRAASRWMPNFENSLNGGGSILGIDTTAPYTEVPSFVGGGEYPAGKNGPNKYVLIGITMADGWGRELYYSSEPPYQSYRVWSAGPNGATFPPWINLEDLSSKDRKSASQWVEDDIARFDR
ncbi:MAG: type II secretion system protein [bacterium]